MTFLTLATRWPGVDVRPLVTMLESFRSRTEGRLRLLNASAMQRPGGVRVDGGRMARICPVLLGIGGWYGKSLGLHRHEGLGWRGRGPMIHVRRHLVHEGRVRGGLEGAEVWRWLVGIRMHINVQVRNMTRNVGVLGHLWGHPLGCR